MKNIKITLLTAVLAVITTVVFAGGPWPQAKGKGYYKLSEWWLIFDQHYTDQALIDPNLTTGIFNTFLYAEYGLTDRLTLTLNANLFSRNFHNSIVSGTTGEIITPGEGLNAFGDVDLGFKYGLTKPGAKIPIAATLTLGIPTGTLGSGELGILQTGDGEFNQIIQIDGGYSFKLGENIGAYTTAYSGVNIRSKGFSEELRLGAELGLSFFTNRLWLISRFNVIESFKNGDTTSNINSVSIFANNTEFTSLGVELNYYLTEKVGLSAGYTGAIRGEIIAAAPSYSFGVFLDLSK